MSSNDPDAPALTNLIRREKVRFDGEPEEGGVAMVMCHDVDSLHFELWDETRWNDRRDDWLSEEASDADGLPAELETLSF